MDFLLLPSLSLELLVPNYAAKFVVFFAYVLYRVLWDRLFPVSRATNVGAELLDVSAIPKIRGRLPGNIDILWQLIYNESHEYCGETLRTWAEIYGPTYDLNILFAHQVHFTQKFFPF